MDYSDVSTVELPVTTAEPQPRRGGVWRELSGALAVGMSVLAVVVIVFQVLAVARDMPGPGVWTVLGHIGAAVLAVVAQRFVDRRRGWLSAAAVLAVVAVAGAALWLYWWA
jgi:hypothetical protein